MSNQSILMEYRMERKKEGASDSELKLYDSEVISNILSTKNTTLLEYRIMRTKEGASKDELAIMDTHIFKEFGTTPIRLGNIKVRTLKNDFFVTVDLNRETVSDLVKKIALHIGESMGKVKVIFKGKHLDEYYMNHSLFSIQLEKDSEVGICFRLGCDGRGCCDVGYNMLCDMLLKKTESVFNTISEDTRKNVLYTLAELDIFDKLYKSIDNTKAENEKVLKQNQEILEKNKKQSEINDKLYKFLSNEVNLLSTSSKVSNREAFSFLDFESKPLATCEKLFKRAQVINPLEASLWKVCLAEAKQSNLTEPIKACIVEPKQNCVVEPKQNCIVEPKQNCIVEPVEKTLKQSVKTLIQSETIASEAPIALDEDLYG